MEALRRRRPPRRRRRPRPATTRRPGRSRADRDRGRRRARRPPPRPRRAARRARSGATRPGPRSQSGQRTLSLVMVSTIVRAEHDDDPVEARALAAAPRARAAAARPASAARCRSATTRRPRGRRRRYAAPALGRWNRGTHGFFRRLVPHSLLGMQVSRRKQCEKLLVVCAIAAVGVGEPWRRASLGSTDSVEPQRDNHVAGRLVLRKLRDRRRDRKRHGRRTCLVRGQRQSGCDPYQVRISCFTAEGLSLTAKNGDERCVAGGSDGA